MGRIIALAPKSLRSRIILQAVIVGSVAALAIGLLNTFWIYEVKRETALEGLEAESRAMALRYEHAFEQMANDAFVIGKTPPIQGIFRSGQFNGIDPLDGSTLRIWRGRLETIFESIMAVRPAYSQIRYIGLADGGMEIVRVNRTPAGTERVALVDLQRKGSEPYFAAGVTLSAEEAFFSPVTLNREHGTVDAEQTPTIRAVVPVFGQDGSRFGIIVINADYPRMLASITSEVDPERDLFIATDRGDLFVHRAGGGQSEFHRGGAASPVSAIANALTEGPDANGVTSVGSYVLSPTLLLPGSHLDGPHLILALGLDRSVLMADALSALRWDLLAMLLIMLACAAVAGTLVRRVTQPLARMTETVRVAGTDGDLAELPVGREDEIGLLARGFRDLTRRLAAREAQSRVILDRIVDAVVTMDDEGIVRSANPAAQRMFGYPEADMIGRSVSTLWQEGNREIDGGHVSRFDETGAAWIIGSGREVEARRSDGSPLPLDLSISEIRTADGRFYTGVMRDISGRRAADAERDRLIADLKRSNDELDNFAYVASHDLKAPLRVIDNASRWLAEDLEPHLTDDTRESLSLLQNRVMRMERLLDDMLQHSRIGRERKDCSAPVTGTEILETIRGLVAKPDGFSIVAGDGLAHVRVRRMPLQTVLLNLVGNAIKHHDRQDGRVVVNARDLGDRIDFSVTDDGPGIAPEFHERVFGMFQTLKPRDQVEGSGMGLAFVRKHVEVVNGTLTLESQVGAGSRFRFTWPGAREAHEEGGGYHEPDHEGPVARAS